MEPHDVPEVLVVAADLLTVLLPGWLVRLLQPAGQADRDGEVRGLPALTLATAPAQSQAAVERRDGVGGGGQQGGEADLVLTHSVQQGLAGGPPPASGPRLDTALAALQLGVISEVCLEVLRAVSPHTVQRR